ncbi:MAG: hypothetical protein AAGC55_12935, partial [Myxococcota bacterium]
AVAPGSHHVLVLERPDQTFTAVAVLATAPDVDLGETPRAVHAATIVALHHKPFGSGTLIWVESRARYTDSDMGTEQTTEDLALTLCIDPADTARAPYCHAPLTLGQLESTYEPADDACTLTESSYRFAAAMDASGTLAVILDHGRAPDSRAGHYRL